MSTDAFDEAMRATGFPPPPRKPRRPKPHVPTAREEFEAVFGPVPTPAGIVHGVVDGMIDNFRRPEFRVEFTAAVIAVFPCARMRLPFLPTMLVAFAAGKAAAWAYTSAEEIKGKLGGSDAAGRV